LTPIKIAIALVGGLLLVPMGIGMFRSVGQAQADANEHIGSPIAAGILLSAGNPYFLVWWATVGAAMVLSSTRFGLWGFWLFAICHLLCDLLWITFLSALSFTGKQFFGQRFQKTVFAVCGIFLFFSSGKLVVDAITMLFAQQGLPT
jgi:threonine/homoserine/homoserine lactone efflux protein